MLEKFGPPPAPAGEVRRKRRNHFAVFERQTSRERRQELNWRREQSRLDVVLMQIPFNWGSLNHARFLLFQKMAPGSARIVAEALAIERGAFIFVA